MAVVSGTITFNTPITTDILVQAFDKDMRSEQLLGKTLLKGPFSASAFYRIQYREQQFQSAEAKSADLIVHVRTADGRFAAESEIVFNT